MKTTFANKPFVAGESVVCYFNEVVTYGEVVSADGDKVTVAIEYNVYPKNEARTTELSLTDYVRRSDGIYVTDASLNERVPSVMMVHVDDELKANIWRYYPSPIEKLKRKFVSSF